MFLLFHRTFFALAGGANAGKTIIFIKKYPKIEFCAAKSHPMMVISSFLEALKDIVLYLECFGAIFKLERGTPPWDGPLGTPILEGALALSIRAFRGHPNPRDLPVMAQG